MSNLLFTVFDISLPKFVWHFCHCSPIRKPKWCCNDARMISHVLSFKMICVTFLSDDSKCQKWAIYFSQFLTYPRLSLYGIFAIFVLLGSPKWCCNDARMIPHVLSFKMICVTSLSDDSKCQKWYVSIWFSFSCGVVSFCSFLDSMAWKWFRNSCNKKLWKWWDDYCSWALQGTINVS